MIDHISLSVLEAVAAPLNVGVPLAVAALGNVIGPVDVIAAIDDQGSRPRGRSRSRQRGHDYEDDHVHGVDHVRWGTLVGS